MSTHKEFWDIVDYKWRHQPIYRKTESTILLHLVIHILLKLLPKEQHKFLFSLEIEEILAATKIQRNVRIFFSQHKKCPYDGYPYSGPCTTMIKWWRKRCHEHTCDWKSEDSIEMVYCFLCEDYHCPYCGKICTCVNPDWDPEW